MRVVMIWRDDTDYARTVIEWLHEFERRTGRAPESISPDTPEGESICEAYDVVMYPTILAFDDEGRLLQEWRGADPSLPRIDDVNYYLMDKV